MSDATAQTQPPIDPQALAAQGIPAPAGTTENGEPYWIISGQKILWSQLQEVLWSKQSTGGGSRGFEQMPQMPVAQFEQALELASENKPERGPEMNAERKAEEQEQKAESGDDGAAQPKTDPQHRAPQDYSKKGGSIFGHSAKTSVDTSDISEMVDFHNKHATKVKKGKPVKSSNVFLATLFGKLLKGLLSFEAKK
jgi:hypothetical protein